MKLSIVLTLLTAASAFAPSTFVRRAQPVDVSSLINSPTRLQRVPISLASAAAAETYTFDADAQRVMEIVINSLYSDKQVFLRELVSNAADACDKARFLALSDGNAASSDLGIKIVGSEDKKTLIIEDTGVGMTKDELMNNLGRIAQSGTKKFAEAMKEGKSDDLSLIGQFGVGFYSGFLVADKMTVETRSAVGGDDAQWFRWESENGSSYTIEEMSDAPEALVEGGAAASAGTRLTLHLKDDCLNFANSFTVKDLLKKYSEFIEFPIELYETKTTYDEVPDEEANKDLKEGEEPKTKTVPNVSQEFTLMNTQKPIWLRSPREVEEPEYAEFYKAAFKASYDEPMAHTHFNLEGQVECKSVLYIPGMLPFELSKNMFDEETNNLKLYVKRVFINDSFEDLIPRYLKFIRGVVDSDDLPLNVGREILQKSKMLNVINKRLVRKSLDMVKSIEEKGYDEYMKFWKNFGKYMKVGVVEDSTNTQELAGYCRFQGTKDDSWRSLNDYVKDMPEGQDKIYYVVGDGKSQCEMSPSLEGLKKKGYEVLYMVEPLDEIAMQTLGKFKDVVSDKEFSIEDATKAKFDEDEDEKAAKEKAEEQLKSTLEYLEETLKGKVESVKVSSRLSESPAVLVQGEYGMSPQMQRYMQAQAVAMGEDENMSGMLGQMNQVILEINPDHKIVKKLDDLISGGGSGAEDYAKLIFDLAGITSGYDVDDPKGFSNRLVHLMSQVEFDGGVKDAEVV